MRMRDPIWRVAMTMMVLTTPGSMWRKAMRNSDADATRELAT